MGQSQGINKTDLLLITATCYLPSYLEPHSNINLQCNTGLFFVVSKSRLENTLKDVLIYPPRLHCGGAALRDAPYSGVGERQTQASGVCSQC